MSRENGATPEPTNSEAAKNNRGAAVLHATVRRADDDAHPCDFCGAARTHYRYGCKDFAPSINGTRLRVAMRGDWWACHLCHDLIERDQWARLHTRVTKAHRRRYSRLYGPPTAAETAAMAEQLHVTWHQFRTHRTGPAVALGGAS